MGVGYLLGCLVSILLWKLDRQKLFKKLDFFLNKILKYKLLVVVVYIASLIILYLSLGFIKNKEIYNFITALLVIDISNSEKKNLELREKIKFYDSITLACKSLLCGFIAPLFYILIFSSNFVGIIYSILYNLSETTKYQFSKYILNIFNVIPSLLIQAVLYIIYAFRNKSFIIDFKGDYLFNTVTNPLLNIEIMAAYVESVNFYYHFSKKDLSFIKSYGKYNNKIDELCVRDYLSINYAIAFIFFIIFISLNLFF